MFDQFHDNGALSWGFNFIFWP